MKARRIIIIILKTLVILAAAANLVALFAFQYKLPDWLTRYLPMAAEATPTPLVLETPYVEVTPEPEESLSIPVLPVNYSGEEDMDSLVLSGVYLMGADGQPVPDADIRYEILPGESRLKKVLRYSVELESGAVLTTDRAMNLTSRYTGPTIALLGMIPDIDPAERDTYVASLIEDGIIRADDGFGNDVTDQLEEDFIGLSDENPTAELTLSLENQVHDTAELELDLSVLDYTGVVLTLSQYHVTTAVGDESFNRYDYVESAHDAEGNDLTDRIESDSNLNIWEPGECEIWFWVYDDEEVCSPVRTLYVSVVDESAEAEEAP